MEHYKNLSLEDIDGEIWKDVIGYEGLYKVSSFGRVKSLAKKRPHRFGFSYKKERILRQAKRPENYLLVGLVNYNVDTNTRKEKTHSVHRLVATAFILNPENKKTVNHKKGIRDDNRVAELEWMTQQENVQDCFDSGRKSQKGDKCPRAILTEKKVIEIRKKFIPCVITRKMLSIEYGVSVAAIKKVLTKNGNWAHI